MGSPDPTIFGVAYGMTSIALSDADNDSLMEIYSCSYINGSAYRFKWNNNSEDWNNTLIYTNVESHALGICVGEGRDIGTSEVYVSLINGQISEVSLDPDSGIWNSIGIGSGRNRMNSIDIGSIYNDSNNAVYGACADGHAYEFVTDYQPPSNPLVKSDTHPVQGEWYSKNRVHVIWSDQGNDRSGIDGYSYIWDSNATTIPPASKTCEESVHDVNSSVLPDGDNYYFHIRARDNSLNWNMTAAHYGPIRIDSNPPGFLNLKINNGESLTESSDVMLSVEAYDPSPGSGMWKMSFSNDGLVYSNWTDWQNVTPWSLVAGDGGTDNDGNKTVFFKAQDRAGNIGGPVNATIFLDREVPYQLNLMIDTGALYTNKNIVSLSIAGLDQNPGSGISYMALSNNIQDSGVWEPFIPFKENWSLTNGSGADDGDGIKTVYLKLKDSAGNVGGPINDTIFLDRVKPSSLKININSGADIVYKREVNLSLHCFDPEPSSGISGMQFSDDGENWTNLESFNNSRNYTLPNQDGTRSVYFRVMDRAGNLAEAVSANILLNMTQDKKPPYILNVEVADITEKSAIIMWETDETADSRVEYGLGSNYDLQLSNAHYVFQHGLFLQGLSSDTTYHFRVISVDLGGNSGGSGGYSFHTDRYPFNQDTTPPVISGLQVGGISDKRAVVIWLTDEPADGLVEFGQTNQYGLSIENPALTFVHSVILENLNSSTEYHLRVKSSDAFGNGPSISSDIIFKTNAGVDIIPPKIMGIRVLNISDANVTINWLTDEPSDSFVEFGLDTSYGHTANSRIHVFNHTIELTGLDPDTTYHFRVMSTDPAGNPSIPSLDFSFKTSNITQPGPKPNPTNGSDDRYIWILLSILICLSLAIGGVYYRMAKKKRDGISNRDNVPYSGKEMIPVGTNQYGPAQGVGDNRSEPLKIGMDDELEILSMDEKTLSTGVEHPSSAPMPGSLSSQKSRSIDWQTDPRVKPVMPLPLKNVSCPICTTHITIYNDIPQKIICPNCGKQGVYRPRNSTNELNS
jgi:predicted RNA-binding Zn-ribbon protein involved in translation (DUF1610 family)